MQNPVKKNSISLSSTKSVLRTIIFRSLAGKWIGCVYLSPFDLTGQILVFIKTKTSTLPPELSKIPVWIFLSPDRSEIEAQMIETINSIIKNK